MFLNLSRFGTRKQFLLVDGRTIYGFVSHGQKFSDCTRFIDKTCDVECKVDIKNIKQRRRYKYIYSLPDCEEYEVS